MGFLHTKKGKVWLPRSRKGNVVKAEIFLFVQNDRKNANDSEKVSLLRQRLFAVLRVTGVSSHP